MNIPEELVTEIISRLPVRSLLRFKCVSKSWCNRISAKDFTFLHFNNYKSSDLVLAGLVQRCQPLKLAIANVSQPTTIACAEEAAAATLPLPFVCRSRIVDYPVLPQQQDFDKIRAIVPEEVCGPCNGILCFYRYYKESIFLWNPRIQDFKIIPQSNLPRQAIQRPDFNYTVGFGFDSETNDYKILQIVQNTQHQQQLELYSLATNSWRKLDYASPLDSFCVSLVFTAVNRKFGWLGNKKQIIFLFDVSDETLDMIPISLERETARRTPYLNIFPFRESIAVVISTVIKVPSLCGYCEIWMLNDFSCARSRCWTKLWTIELENFFWPLGFCGNSDLIFHGWDSFKLKLYDLLNNDVVDVGASMVTTLVYKESLISISSNKRNK